MAQTSQGERALARASSYDDWESQFFKARLGLALWFGAIGNANFILADYLFYPDQFPVLLRIRLVVQILVVGLLVFHRRQQTARFMEPVLLGVVWSLGFGIAQMTTYIGGFTSAYYAGINLVLIGSAVIAPVRLRAHVVGQLGILIYYFAVNRVLGPQPPAWDNAALNGFFLFWTCLLIDASILLYTRLQRAEFDTRIELATTMESRERERLRNEFYANMNHELRTPLTLILGGFRTLLRERDPEIAADVANTGLRNTSRLLTLINQMLDLARIDSGRSMLNKQIIDLGALVRQVASNFESSSDRRHIQIRGIDRPVPIALDVQQAKKVLYNLLSNAFKFTDPQLGQVWIRLRVLDTTVELQVEDNGVGIPQDQLDRIFGRFARVSSTSSTKIEGTGIGLALVKEIITAHEGTITVESEVGQGTTFTMHLPQGDVESGTVSLTSGDDDDMIDMLHRLAQRPDPNAPARTSTPEPRAMPGPDAPTVLVVEDNDDLRGYLSRLLGEEMHVVTAPNGEEGLKEAKRILPALVLSDAMMPRMTGRELLAAMRADPDLRATPVIFLTAAASTEARVESLSAGADDYLTKPFVEEELLARVRNLLRFRAQERQLRDLNARLEARIETQMASLVKSGSLSRFLPSTLVQRVMEGSITTSDHFQRRKVTILFVDMVGFTLLTDHLEPEELYSLLNEYLREMTGAAIEHGGTVDKFIGDALMVVYGVSSDMGEVDQARGAVRTALEMHRRIAALSTRWHRRGIQEALAVRIGINTGYCTVGVFGSEMLRSYTAVGSPVNIAARLQSECAAGDTLCGFSTYALLRDAVEGEPLGALQLKGVAHPVEAWRVRALHDELVEEFSQP